MRILHIALTGIIVLYSIICLENVFAKELRELYDKAYFLEIHEGQAEAAIEIYRGIVCEKLSDNKRDIIVKSLKRLLKLYEESDTIIIPGERVGPFNFDINKNLLLKMLGEPKKIFYGKNSYRLQDMPSRCNFHYGNIYFMIVNDLVKRITVLDTKYKFNNGIRVGTSEDEVKKAFGDNYILNKGQNKDFLIYKEYKLRFKIHKSKRIVMEINIRKN